MKENYIHYSMTPFKGVCVPFTGDPEKAVSLDDLIFWPTREDSRPEKDRFTLRRDERHLYISFTRHKPTPVQIHPPGVKGNLWDEGDLIELLFGSVDGSSFLLQLAVGASGNRFDSTGDYDSWSCKVACEKYSWSGEITLPLEKLHLQDLGCAFDFFITD